MNISLQKATLSDCAVIHKMQICSFSKLLHKYGDVATNPGAEPFTKVVLRMKTKGTFYYLIKLEGINIGALRIAAMPEQAYRIAPIFLLPEYQGRGFAQQALLAVENLFPNAHLWQLDTIQEEPMLCHVYEKMGYRQTGVHKQIQENMTIVYYEKPASLTYLHPEPSPNANSQNKIFAKIISHICKVSL